jgi:LysR family transcriptional regulator, transcription activator of glutamate synthase operon
MKINDLKEFIVLTQKGNFLEAAENLSSSQSNLSKHIKRIETELGVPLFDRTSRKVSISKYGQLLLPDAREIVELQGKYTEILQSRRETGREILTVGSIHSLAQYNITNIFADFKNKRPNTTINVMRGGSEEMKEMLRQKIFDLAFIRFFDEVEDDLVTLPYAVDTMVAVLPVTHPLAHQKKVDLRMLANEDFLLVGKQTMLYRLSISACEQSGFSPKIAYTDHNVDDLCELVAKGMGIALLMKQLALYVQNTKIAIVDITPRIATQINLCYLKDNELSAAAKKFIECTSQTSFFKSQITGRW